MSDFNSLNLAKPLNEALVKLGYENPTPIQFEAIPEALVGRDLMGIAQTGTGKTAAFALPSLHHIATHAKEPPRRGARVLVLAPTRELVTQIAESYKDYGQFIPHFSVTTIFGGVPIPRQIKRVSGGNDVLVATPGRLIDLLERKAVSLTDIEILVLDEADQMMDMGFIHALKKIVPLLPKQRQTLFFSATMVPAIKKLAGQFLTNPVHVSVAPANTTAEKVDQSLVFVNAGEKQGLLALSLLDPAVERALVFTRTKHGADRVVKRLAAVGIDSTAIHGNKSQGQRTRALNAFRSGTIKVMIATDVAARGIDIDDITHVFNFEIPNVPEQYVHRIGRTARANRGGQAIAFVSQEERKYLKEIQKLLQMEIPVAPLPDDFINQVKALNKREPIVHEKPPAQQRRKGRGKSKKKGRYSKDKAKKQGGRKDGGNEAEFRERKPRQTSSNPDGSRAKRKAKSAQNKAAESETPLGKTVRGGRSRDGTARDETHAAKKPGGGMKPYRGKRNISRQGKPGGKPGSGSGGKSRAKSGGKSGGKSGTKSGIWSNKKGGKSGRGKS